MKRMLLRKTFICMIAMILVLGMLPATAFATHRSSDGYPLDLNDNVVLSVYTGTVFPGEPYTHVDTSPYVSFNGSFHKISSGSYASRATTVLNPGIRDAVTQGTNLRYGNITYYVWGVYDTSTGATSDGLANYFVDGRENPIFNDTNETTMIAAAKNISRDAAANYEIVWYVVKYQTSDTAWHIDGIIRPRNSYSVNYYGNGSTNGGAPTGKINLPENTEYTVLGNVGSKENNQDILTRVIAGVTYNFVGWNTKADGSGTPYVAGDKVTLNDTTTVDHTLSLYAQWASETKYKATAKIYLDGQPANLETAHGSDVELFISKNGSTYTKLEKEASTGIYSATVTENGEYSLYHLHEGEDNYEALGTYHIPINNANGEVEVLHYSVNYHTGDGALPNADESYRSVHLRHADATVISETPTREGYLFTGWNTKENGSGTAYAPNDVIPDLHERQDLYAQWLETVDVYVNVTIDHMGESTMPDTDDDKDSVELLLLTREGSGAYHEIEGGTLALTNASHEKHDLIANTEKTEYKANGATFTNLPGGSNVYTVTTQKTGYDVKSITAEKNSDGDWVIDVVLEFAPDNVDLAFSVSMHEDVPKAFYPKEVIAKATYYNTDTNAWEYLAEHMGEGTGLHMHLNADGKAEGTYSVWNTHPDTEDAYGYRFEIISFVYPDGTTICPAEETTEGTTYSDGVYTATMDEVTDGLLFGALNGAYFENKNQIGTLHAVISMDLHDVIFDANDDKATIKSARTYTLEDQYAIPKLSDYVPVHEDKNYLFGGWYLEAACTTPAVEGTTINTNVTLYAKWIAPLTIRGDVTIASSYESNGEIIEINARDRAEKAIIRLEEIGVMGEILQYEVTFAYTYNSAGIGTASYEFTVPYSAKQYEILTGINNYAVTYANEPSVQDFEDIASKQTANDAVFDGDNDPNTAIVNIKMDWAPESYDQELVVDADEIGEGFRPTSAEAVIYYRDIDDDHHFDILPRHADSSVSIALNNDLDGNSIKAEGDATVPLPKYHFDGSRYEYTMYIPKLIGNVDGVFPSESPYDPDTVPFYIDFSDTTTWSIAQSKPMGGYEGTGVLKATLYPNAYTVTFDLNADGDTVTGMDTYKTTDADDNEIYTTSHTWSYTTAISAEPSRTGYDFIGWTCATDGAYDAQMKEIAAAVAQDITLVAQWAKKTYGYTVEFWYDHTDPDDPQKFVRDDSMTKTAAADYGHVISIYNPLVVKENYLLDHTEGLPLTISADEAQNVIRLYYRKDAVGGQDGGDGIPDCYQKPVTFHVVNGTWADSTTTPIVTYVTLCDGFGNYDADGSGALVIPISMQPFSGYSAGKWDLTPPDTVTGTAPAEYTFRYHRTPPPSDPSESPEEPPIPPTGDGNELYYLAALAFTSLIGMSVLHATDRRKRHSADHR